MHGSGTRSRRSPSRRTFSTGLARDGRLPIRASRSSRMVRGASLGRGAGWAGIGWSGGATTGAGSLGRAFGLDVAGFAGVRVATVCATRS